MSSSHIMFICGESSGDILAAELIQALKHHNPNYNFSGIVGDECKKHHVHSLVPLDTIAVMGITEIFSSLKRIRNAIHIAMEHIKNHPIDCVICVDAFAFTHRIAEKIKQYHPKVKIIKYVPPKLWAWGAWRVNKLKIYDLILNTLPFEKAFFDPYQIQTHFVGHSVLERLPPRDQKENERFIKKYQLDINRQTILLLPGSRRSEIKTLLPLFLKVADHFKQMHFLLPIAPGHKEYIQTLFLENNLSSSVTFIQNSQDRYTAFHLSDYALAASGTVSLELMLSHTPCLIAYRFSWLTYYIAKLLVKIRYASLANIIFNKEILPEFLQSQCNEKDLSDALKALTSHQEIYQKQLDFFPKIKQALSPQDGKAPSYKAAEYIHALIQ